ncbi:MAG TPA: hypothetical protein VMM18_12895 [Gemmatimonadaceae bacterium]|nr:hypothetical protein [Gemmatimonadaceae bacterium]
MRPRFSLIVVAALVYAACGDGPSPPTTGDLRVSVATTGGDLDEDGYGLSVDGGQQRAVAVNGTVDFTALSAGTHTVELTGLADNCTVSGSNPAQVIITAGSTTPFGFAIACSATGVLITVATAGIDLDADGYTVSIGDVQSGTIAPNGTLTITRLDAGAHSVTLAGVAANCAVDAPNPATTTIVSGEVAEVEFTATCIGVTGSVAVSTSTTGIDLDTDGYAVSVDGLTPRTIAANGTTVFEGLTEGEHTIALANAAGNCSIAEANPRVVQVVVGSTTRDTARTAFEVVCGAISGSIEVTLATSGQDRDPNGFLLRLDGGSARTVATQGSTVFDGVTGGTHDVVIDDVAGNCTVTGGDTRSVSVTTGGPTRDTARTTFSVACEAVWNVAFVRMMPGYYYDIPTVMVARADGADSAALGDGEEPDWSPDGERIVFQEFRDCDGYYGNCRPVGLSVMNADGSGLTSLTSNTSDDEPAWSPDGSRIAFTRMDPGGRRTLHLMNANGSSQTKIPLPELFAATVPAWSADGNRLAFECEVVEGNTDICLVGADGTGFLRLTTAAESDRRPAWSPDGARIAFTTSHEGRQSLALMDADGSNASIVATGTGVLQPAWSPDGARFAFVEFTCDIYTGCRFVGLAVINVDGSGKTTLTSSERDRVPDWRP